MSRSGTAQNGLARNGIARNRIVRNAIVSNGVARNGMVPNGLEQTRMTKVLEGVRIVEHGTFITGPAASMLLADLGADVVKVEMPGTGDPFRAFKGGLYSPHYQTYNRNKRSITLDLKDPADIETVHQLVHRADVLVENFRPGVMDRAGLSWNTLSALNPRLIVTRRGTGRSTAARLEEGLAGWSPSGTR